MSNKKERVMDIYIMNIDILIDDKMVSKGEKVDYKLEDPKFGKSGLNRKRRHEGHTTQSLYITMRDGVKIAVDVILPKNLPSGAKIPVLMTQTCYWRAYDVRAPFRWFQKPSEYLRFFTSHGYALVIVDVRGTGASFGTRPFPWARDEIMDGGEIVEWIVTQSWSNGKVGAIGISYLGATAELLAVNNHPAVKAVIPRFSQFDLYTNTFPGGVFTDRFVEQWSNLGSSLDMNKAQEMVVDRYRLLEEKEASLGNLLPRGFRLLQEANKLKMGRYALRGVKPVDNDKDRRLLKNAIQAHASNGDVYKLCEGYNFRDDLRITNDAKEMSVDDISVHSFKEDIERSNVGIFSWGSWLDDGTADGVINRFLTFSNLQRAVIGPWNHGAQYHASPYKPVGTPVDPSEREQWMECLRFFDHHLEGSFDDEMGEKILIYYTLGEGRWKRTKTWPPVGSTTQRWYLSADNVLSQNRPTAETGMDTYTVDFEATTGITNRWHTQLGFAVVYTDRAEKDLRLLTYTSRPLEEDAEITGHPVATLYVTSTATDGAFFVYLEDVDDNGRVTYITEGQLRAIHRKVSADPPPYTMLVPYHSFKRKDAMPLVPGEIAELTFGLLPTSVLIRKKHRIRIAIAGHDKDTFARLPQKGTPVITIARNKQYASYIDLPIPRAQT